MSMLRVGETTSVAQVLTYLEAQAWTAGCLARNRDRRLPTADAVLNVLTSSRYRRGSLRAMDIDAFRESCRGVVVQRIRQQQPIQITLIGFPFKVPNPLKVADRTVPDLAELIAIRRLRELNDAVKSVYPPGIELILLQDGTFIAGALGLPPDDVRSYRDHFARMLRWAGAEGFVQTRDLADLMCRVRPRLKTDLRSCLRQSWKWMRDADQEPDHAVLFRKTLGMVNSRFLPPDVLAVTYPSLHLHALPESGAPRELYLRVLTAMRRYYALDLLLHEYDPRPAVFPAAMHATTKSRTGRLALWLVERGKGLLPWHGVGIIRRDGRLAVRWASTVIAQGFRPVYMEGEATPFYYREGP